MITSQAESTTVPFRQKLFSSGSESRTHVIQLMRLSWYHLQSIPRFWRSRRVRTSDLRFWRPTFYQLNYAPIVELPGRLERPSFEYKSNIMAFILWKQFRKGLLKTPPWPSIFHLGVLSRLLFGNYLLGIEGSNLFLQSQSLSCCYYINSLY